MTSDKRHKDNDIDVERAKLVPDAEFAHPDDVAETPKLTHDEKKKILNQWEVDAQALSRAAGEGMTNGEPPRLPDVQAARRKVVGRSSAAKGRRTSGKPAG